MTMKNPPFEDVQYFLLNVGDFPTWFFPPFEAKLRRDCFIVPKGEVPSEAGMMSNKKEEHVLYEK